MRRGFVTAAVSLGLCAHAAPAHAAYIKSFTIREAGSRIAWNIVVCTSGQGRAKKFLADLVPEDGITTYSRTWSGGRTGPGCTRWRMRAEDIWAEGVWDSQMKVVMGDGEILRTQYKSFYIE